MDFTDVTRDFILKHISEEEIFEYFGLSVITYKFKNPYRVDRNPTCQFYRTSHNDRLRLRDWTGWFHGDCFDWIMFRQNVDYNGALNLVANAFKLLQNDIIIHRTPLPNIIIEAKTAEIKVKRRNWLQLDRDFWGRWDFQRNTIKLFEVKPLSHIWLNDVQIYIHQVNNPAYVYWFGGLDYKIYFPYADKGRKFLHSNPNILQGYDILPVTGEFMVITKSYKDVMKLYEYGVPAVAPMSESQIIKPEMWMHLKNRFDKIFSFYDYDYIGIKSMQKMKKLFGITPLYLKPPMPKDFTDFYEYYGDDETKLLIQTVKNDYL